MKIILISSRADKVRTISLNSWAKGLLSVLLLGIPVAAGTMLGVKIADGRWELLFDNSIGEMQHQLVVQQSHVDAGREQLDTSLAAMTGKLAQMRSRLVRLDALGEQLTQLASLEDGEFDFSVAPGLGGPDTTLVTEVANSVDIQQQLSTMFARLDSSLDSRESQLILLQSMLKFASVIPLGRFSQPRDIANACLYLASDEADFITGACIEVDGGRCV